MISFFSSFSSDLTSVSRQINHRLLQRKGHSFTYDDENSQLSSTSLKLRWEGEPEWEDEFQGKNFDFLFIIQLERSAVDSF